MHPCPYRGLLPYTEGDTALFFGRDTERRVIKSNLRASRLTVLYGQSGAGKTSLLTAGVVHDLKQEALEDVQDSGRPEHSVVLLRSWRDGPVVQVTRAIEESAA